MMKKIFLVNYILAKKIIIKLGVNEFVLKRKIQWWWFCPPTMLRKVGQNP
jgi:hypothetical protein